MTTKNLTMTRALRTGTSRTRLQPRDEFGRWTKWPAGRERARAAAIELLHCIGLVSRG